MGLHKHKVLLVVGMILFSSTYAQRTSWYFPEYKFSFRPSGSCDQTIVRSIQNWQYLRIRTYDSCKYIEVSCYRSKDSTLKERGLYYNTNDVYQYSSRGRTAGTDSVFVASREHVIYKRVGRWEYYDRRSKVIKVINYKKPD